MTRTLFHISSEPVSSLKIESKMHVYSARWETEREGGGQGGGREDKSGCDEGLRYIDAGRKEGGKEEARA